MKKAFSILVLFVMVGAHPAYVYKDKITHKIEDTFSDRADHVLNANVLEEESIEVFKNETYGQIQLLAGTEKDFGFRHILARHTKNYFVNYDNKNENSFFDDEVSGTDLIYGIKQFYENCIDVELYNTRSHRNIAYLGYTELDGKRIKCLLAVRKETMEIVTFYPFDEERRRYDFD